MKKTQAQKNPKKSQSMIQIKDYINDIALLRLLALVTDSVVAIPKISAERELKENKLVVLHKFRWLFQKFYLVLRQNRQRFGKILGLSRANVAPEILWTTGVK